MVVKKLLIIVMAFLSYVSYGEEIDIDTVRGEIYINNVLLNSPLINERLGTVVLDKQGTFEIENSYVASALNKSKIKYIFDKRSGQLKAIAKSTYDTQFDGLYGYYVNILNGDDIESISLEKIEKIEKQAEPINYNFQINHNCLALNLVLNDEENTVNYCNIKKNSGYVIEYIKNSRKILEKTGYLNCDFDKKTFDFSIDSCKKVSFVILKSHLYTTPNEKTKMYLIKGDMVTLLDEQTDDKGQKWYFINYKGKKDLTMWIKAEAIDSDAGNPE